MVKSLKSLPIGNKPSIISCKINDFDITFEIDSGSFISTLCYEDVIKLGATINNTNCKLKAYGGSQIEVIGETNLEVNYEGVKHEHKFIVVASSKINLFGRDLCTKFKVKLIFDETDTINHVKDNVLNKFEQYLSDDFTSNVKTKVHIDVLPGAKPIFQRARPVPIRLKEAVSAELKNLVKSGKITKIYSSEWATPTVNVVKTNNDIRICGDFSGTVNKFLEPVKAPLVSIDEVISQVGGAKFFSKIDLSQAFLQLPLDESSKKFTTINTHEGLFHFNFMCFGLRSSPGIFQSFMLKLLNGIENVIIYQDDLLILTETIEQHEEILNKVLSTLKEGGIKINVKKSEFFIESVQYLGHVFSKNGVKPSPRKVEAILKAPSPTNIKQVQSWVGLCNFFSKFIPKFADVMNPFYVLLKKGANFVWGKSQQDSFEKIKIIFAKDTMLQIYNPKYETVLECDGSGYGIGAVLLQRKSPDHPYKAVEYVSRSLNNAEKQYSNIERECLSVVFGVEKFKKYLLGSTFSILNDQKPLKKLLNNNSGVPSTCSARIQRWYLKLSQFTYNFMYSKGKDNVTSDFLSRMPLPQSVNVHEPYEMVFAIDSLENLSINCDLVKKHTDDDKMLVDLKNVLISGEVIGNDSPLKMFKNHVSKMSILQGCIMYGARVLIPTTLRSRVMELIHEGHPGIVAMKNIARSLIWFPGIDEKITKFVQMCHDCQMNRALPPKAHTKWPKPEHPWSRVHIDHFFYKNKIFLIAIDSFSKYIEVEIVKSVSAEHTVNALKLIFSRNGLCNVIVSDNSTSFTGEIFQNFLKKCMICHVTSPPFTPASNGQAERGVQVVKNLLKKCDQNISIENQLMRVLFYYRTTPHNVTNIAPCYALNNRKYITLKDRVNPKFNNMYSKSDNKAKREFANGDKVYVLNTSSGNKWLSGTIIERIGVNVYNVLVQESGSICKRHCNQLRNRYLENPGDNSEENEIPINLPDPEPETNDEYHDCVSQPQELELRRSNRVIVPPLRFYDEYNI